MKVPTLIITASAMLALVVPTVASAQVLESSASHRMMPATSASSTHKSGQSDAAKIRTLIAKNNALSARIKTLLAQNKLLRNKPTSTENPSNPGSSTSTGQSSNTYDDCAGYMVNCTDEDLCNIWGANCYLVPQLTSTSTDESPAVAPAAETAVADSSQNTSSQPVLPPVELPSNIDDVEYYGGGF